MSTLIVGNTRTEEMAGDLAALSAEERHYGGLAAQRLLWFAEPGDVLALPDRPGAEYLDYITGLTGTDPASLLMICPPPGPLGSDLLTPDRTADPTFREQVRTAVRERGIDRMLAVYKDVPTMRLATEVGLRVPGHAFSEQRGDALLNSKAGFRAIAAGVGAPIVPGLATTRQAEARTMVTELLAAGHSAIVKQEFNIGGQGNEVLSATAGVRAAGALSSVVLAEAAAVREYFEQHWDRLTAGGRHQVVIERYLIGCDTVYSESLIEDDGPVLFGFGEIMMTPLPAGEIVPPPALGPAARQRLVAASTRMAQAYHAIGYRGYVSTDAVLTPDGELFLTETNARMSGSTHLHKVIDGRLLDQAHRGRRVLLEFHDWTVPSFADALRRLSGDGLAFDRQAGTGVVLTSDLMPDGTVTCCVVAENLESARKVRRLLTGRDAGEEAVETGGLQASTA